MASPDGRPWWDKPTGGLDYQTTGDYGAGSLEEEETQRVAQYAIEAATSMIQKGDPTQWAEPTPERRAFLAPAMIEKGFHDPVAAVPEVLHSPYKAFSEMYELLAKGASPSDPEVVKRATEVAGLVVGAGGGGEAASVGSGIGGKIWSKITGKKKTTEFESLETLGIDKDFVKAVEGMGLEVLLNADNHIILKGKGASGSPYAGNEYQTINFGKDTAALEDHLVKLEMQGQVQKPDKASQIANELMKDYVEPTSKKDYTLAQFNTKEEAQQAFKTMSEDNGFKGDPKHSVFEITDAQDKPTGKWSAYNVFENQPPKAYDPVEAFNFNPHGKMPPDYGNIQWHQQISVNGQMHTWHDFVEYNKGTPEIIDMVKHAHDAGIGYITWGGGASPEFTIKVPASKKPPAGASAKNINPEHLPTEMEMSRWPNAKVIDRISIDEAHPGPIIAYHGTRANNFINFDLSKSNDIGIHFGTKEQAGNRSYPGPHTPTSRIIPAHIDVKNPIELPDLGGWFPDKLARAIEDATGATDTKLSDRITKMLMEDVPAHKQSKEYSISGQKKAYESIRNTLNKMGYDSIRYMNTVEGQGWSYIVWQKGKVKSATSPDHILYAGGPGPLPKDRYAEDEDGQPAD